ncbi:hypothetical protein ACFTWH_10520 [Streptomyces sp. NPDC057011]|uniref:hypothetical protein n=1 Tax=unclassified Streptomyces TaxID=2593676 RepID=UPI00362A46DF
MHFADIVQLVGNAAPPLTALVVAAFVLVFLGVVLPAVWSRHAWRRTAAHRTLGVLLRATRRARRTP